MVGYSLGLVEVIENNDDDDTASTVRSSVVPRNPTANEVYTALEHASNTFLSREQSQVWCLGLAPLSMRNSAQRRWPMRSGGKLFARGR